MSKYCPNCGMEMMSFTNGWVCRYCGGFEKIDGEFQSMSRVMTRKEIFLTHYPHAKLTSDGVPYVCCEDLGYGSCEYDDVADCKACWDKRK